MGAWRWSVRLLDGICFLICAWAHGLAVTGQLVDWLGWLFWGTFACAITSGWLFLYPWRKAGKDSPSIRRFLVLMVPALLYPLVVMGVLSLTGGWGYVEGAPSGEPGDRSVNNHGKRVRELTEDEYQRYLLDDQRRQTALMSGFALSTFGVTLIPRPRPVPPPADTPPAPSPEPVPPGG